MKKLIRVLPIFLAFLCIVSLTDTASASAGGLTLQMNQSTQLYQCVEDRLLKNFPRYKKCEDQFTVCSDRKRRSLRRTIQSCHKEYKNCTQTFMGWKYFQEYVQDLQRFCQTKK